MFTAETPRAQRVSFFPMPVAHPAGCAGEIPALEKLSARNVTGMNVDDRISPCGFGISAVKAKIFYLPVSPGR